MKSATTATTFPAHKASEGKEVGTIVVGIDPGWHVSGYAIIDRRRSTLVLVDCNYLAMSPKKSLVERAGIFYDFFSRIIEERAVAELALETPFLGKNAQNFLKLGYLRGLLYLLASKHGLPLCELAPREVKQGITGFGGAGKDQVARVLSQLFRRTINAPKYDVTDAVAIALCAAWRTHANDIKTE